MTMEETLERHLQGWPLARFCINILDLLEEDGYFHSPGMYMGVAGEQRAHQTAVSITMLTDALQLVFPIYGSYRPPSAGFRVEPDRFNVIH